MAQQFCIAALAILASVCLVPDALAQAVVEKDVRPVEGEFTLSANYHQAGWGNYALLGVTGGVALAGLFVSPDRNDPWQTTLGIDESARHAVRLGESTDRRTARTTSDVLAGAIVSLPTLGDAVLNVGLLRRSPKVAWEMSVINLEVLGITAALVGTAKWAFSRERPFGRLCGTELSANSTGCTEDDRYVSYFSGHAAFTFAASSAYVCSSSTLRFVGLRVAVGSVRNRVCVGCDYGRFAHGRRPTLRERCVDGCGGWYGGRLGGPLVALFVWHLRVATTVSVSGNASGPQRLEWCTEFARDGRFGHVG